MPPFETESQERRARRELWVSLGLVLAAAILLLLPVQAQQWISAGLRSTALAPFIWTQEGLQRARVRASEIQQLQATLDSTVAALAAHETLLEENVRLRALLDLRERAGFAFVSAGAIRAGTRGSESMFLLDVGTDHGVAVNDPVVAAEGLVGIVREVGPRTALAMDWTHPDFRVSAMTAEGEAYGIVEARRGAFREDDRLVLDGVPFHTPLAEGAVVVTSGRGPVYPRGIRIGTVLSLAEAEAGWRREYWIRPAVRPASVTHVLVITGEAGTPLSDLLHLWQEPVTDAWPETDEGPETDEELDVPDDGG